MARIDFYVLQSTSLDARLDFAVRLCHKALDHQMKTLLWLDDHNDATALDAKLWQSQPESYLAHALAPVAQPAPPIIIAVNDDYAAYRSLLINLNFCLHPKTEEFERIAEVVVQKPEVLQSTRANFRLYQAAGHQIHMHNISG
jgi:DNA polymerase-3 subunit chi